jgi:alpha-beta hydrolase superfamily lysophospholipase
MPRAKISPSIELEYDTFGDPKNPALLLVMGYTAQMVAWEAEFCKMFAAKNLFVIRFDDKV